MTDSGFISKEAEFESIEKLGARGATSEAFIVKTKGKTFFMKRLRAQFAGSPQYLTLFEKEYEIGKSLNTPHIPQYLSINRENGNMYILMEYIIGESIEEKLQNDPLWFHNKRNIRKMLLQLLDGFDELHKKDILYLDISPKNIMLTKFGGNVKIIDLGFCANAAYHHTAGCTIGFQAPEVEDKRWEEIDAQSDIYSVGMLLQYIETKSGAKFPANIRRIRKRCLCRNKAQRYRSVTEIKQEIENSRTKKWVMTAAIGAFALLALSVLPTCNAVNDYIAWENGKIGNKFEENDIFYRITDHKARTVAVTYKGSHHSEYQFEYKDGTIEIPATVTHRGRRFRVTSIDCNAFDNPETTGLIFPNGLESISDLAFVVCRLTGEVYIPQSIRHIGKLTFEGNTEITSLVVDEANTVYDSRGDCNAIIESATNKLIAACKSTVIPYGITTLGNSAFVMYQKSQIDIPETVTVIEDYAFAQSALTEITLPCNITEIGAQAFENCRKLTKVVSHIPPEKLRPTGNFCFAGIPQDCILYVPRGAKAVYEYTEGWNVFASIVELE